MESVCGQTWCTCTHGFTKHARAVTPPYLELLAKDRARSISKILPASGPVGNDHANLDILHHTQSVRHKDQNLSSDIAPETSSGIHRRRRTRGDWFRLADLVVSCVQAYHDNVLRDRAVQGTSAGPVTWRNITGKLLQHWIPGSMTG